MSNLSNLSPYNRSKFDNSMRMDNSDKDALISQLKSQIFEHEQNEKNFNSLQAKYRSMQNDFSLVSEEKLRLEYELKQRTESLNKQNADLRNESENNQNNLNEKLALNKRLYNDNNNLFRTLESRNAEIEALREQLADYEDANSKLNMEKQTQEKNIMALNDTKSQNEFSIQKCQNEIERLNKICDDNEITIKNQNGDKLELMGRNDELNFEIKNLMGKLKSKEESLNFTAKQLDDANKNISRLEGHIVDLEQNLGRVKMELGNSTNSHAKERAMKIESEKNGERLEGIIKDRSNEIKRLSNELESYRIMSEKQLNEKAKLLGEIERYKNHIMVLTESNQKVLYCIII